MFSRILTNIQAWFEYDAGYARYNQVRVRAGNVFLVFCGVFANLCVRRNQDAFKVGVRNIRCLDLLFDVPKLDNRILRERGLLSTVSETLELVFIASPLGIL